MEESFLYQSIDFTQELLTSDNLNTTLSKGLEVLGHATGVDRVYYWENHYDKELKDWMTSQKLEWCSNFAAPQMNNPELQNLPFEKSVDFIRKLAQNKSFNSHIKDMKDGENKTKQRLKDQGVLSILVLPVFLKSKFIGFMGFDSCKVKKNWSQIEISLLKSFVHLYAKELEQNLLQQKVLQVKDNFMNFFNMTEDLLVVVDQEGRILDMNRNVLEQLNYSREELLGESYLMFHPEHEKKKAQSNFEGVLAEKTAYFNILVTTKEGDTFPTEITNSQGIWDGQAAIFAVVKDVSELTLSEDMFSKAFTNSGVSMFISKFVDGEILEVNDTFLSYVGYTEEEVLGRTTFDLKMTEDFEDRDFIIEQIKTTGKITDLEIKFVSKTNNVRTGLVNIVPITINSEPCLLSSVIDISNRIENEKKILELSNRDTLTNLYNRRFVYESVEEIIRDYKENEEPFSVAIMDLDDFKEINDQYGHQIGDCVLVEFSNVINDNLREYDILGRYGGEEFIILLNHASIEKANKVLNRMLEIVRDTTFTCGGNKIKLTFSAGLTSCKELEKKNLSLDQLVSISDKRMYEAKKGGKNKIVFQ